MGDIANYGVTMPENRPLETFHSNAPGFLPPVARPLPSGAESASPGVIESTGHVDHDPGDPCPGPGPCPLNPTPQPGPIPDPPADYAPWLLGGGIALVVLGALVFGGVVLMAVVIHRNSDETED